MLRSQEATRMSWHWVMKKVTKGLHSRSTFEWANSERQQTYILKPIVLRQQTQTDRLCACK